MDFLFLVLVLPVALAIGCLILLVKKQHKGLFLGILFFCLAIATGFWSIRQSRSSTAGIGILFLPAYGAVCGSLAWVFGQFRSNADRRNRAVAWLCFVASVGLLVFNVYGGFKEQKKNRNRDQASAEYESQIHESRKRIRELLERARGNEVAALGDQIEAHHGDSAFLMAALETPFVSDGELERLSRFTGQHGDGVILMVIRNKNVTPGILARIYHESAYPESFFSDLAGNKNTPPDILRELFINPAGRVSYWLAKNPATPRDILMKLAGSRDGEVLGSMLENPTLDCQIVQVVRNSLTQTPPTSQQSSSLLKSDSILKTCGEIRQVTP